MSRLRTGSRPGTCGQSLGSGSAKISDFLRTRAGTQSGAGHADEGQLQSGADPVSRSEGFTDTAPITRIERKPLSQWEAGQISCRPTYVVPLLANLGMA